MTEYLEAQWNAKIPLPFVRDQLRRQRALRNMSQEEFGRRANYSASTVSAVETGTRSLDLPYAKRADEILDSGGLLESLLKSAQGDGEPTWFKPWVEAERQGRQLRFFEPMLIPGLFQTENYARAVLRLDDTLPESEVEQQVATRMGRQEILTRERPPQIVGVIDESALRRREAIMGEQLAHLLRMAELPHVHINVVPLTAGLHIGLSGPLMLVMLTDGTWVGHLDHQLGGSPIAAEEEVATLLARWEGVRGIALPEDQSVALIKEIESQHGPQ
ncbi:helix-turn-helix domain-containing protein [Micromonospora sp. NBC_01796]|uniref:helix-turn-helix domain-containing protein n=1 Tax=Micromonospora sp. NBC_01796 TaxID=2975987 RepID=UPI002DD8EC01|nr:helix-turn-helix transcriptional regulator [Micromonospora sp. NBC_01796]WSA88944.1 helix-turn-helix transcriptional regulator [Micromonospora sp. NBC_01796]